MIHNDTYIYFPPSQGSCPKAKLPEQIVVVIASAFFAYASAAHGLILTYIYTYTYTYLHVSSTGAV